MPRISKPHPLTPEQRAEIMRKQIEREPERIRICKAERERQIAAEKEREMGSFTISAIVRFIAVMRPRTPEQTNREALV